MGEYPAIAHQTNALARAFRGERTEVFTMNTRTIRSPRMRNVANAKAARYYKCSQLNAQSQVNPYTCQVAVQQLRER